MATDIRKVETFVKKKQKRCSIRSRLILLFLLVSLVPTSIIGTFSYICTRGNVIKQASKYSIDMLTQTVANIQLKLAEFESISLRLFINKDFNSALSGYTKAKGSAVALKQKSIEDYFNEYMISNKDIFAFMFICDSDINKSICITKDYYKDFSHLSQHFKETNSYRSIVVAAGGIVWSNTLKLNRNHFLVLGRSMKDITSGEFLGILAIVVDEDKLDQLANLSLYNQLNISLSNPERFSFIIDNKGGIISSPFKEDIGKNISFIMKNISPLKPIMEYTGDRDYGNEINQGSYITEVHRQLALVTYKSIGSKVGIGGKSGWHLLSVAPTSFLYEEMRWVGLATLLLGLIFAIIAIIISFHVSSCDDFNNKYS